MEATVEIINVSDPISPNEPSQGLSKLTKVNREVLSGLSDIQKSLLITDGTVTELLGCYLDEPVELEKLYENARVDINEIPEAHRHLVDSADFPVLLRKVLLKGKVTLKRCLYAESSILIDRLPRGFREDLLGSDMPIGSLWSKHRFETYKTDYLVQEDIANQDLATCLGISVGSKIFSRTYCVYSQGKRTMIITEKFSAGLFG